MNNKVNDLVKNVKKNTGNMITNVEKKASNVTNKAKNLVNTSKDKVINTMDVNNDGNVDIEDIIILGLKTPGIGINRSEFLKKELSLKYSEETVKEAILKTPCEAKISIDDINKIADNVIEFERNCVTGISTVLGVPGGFSMAATIPADIIQYYGYMLRAAQKLMYLYGFPEINVDENESQFDTETLNMLTICLGVMYGIAGANNAIKAMAKALAVGVEKKLINKALTKGTIYPIVKSIAKWFGVRMTKEVFAGFFKKAIPIVWGAIGSGITYLSFKPCCEKLKSSLQDTMLSNPNHISNNDENIIIDNITIEEN